MYTRLETLQNRKVSIIYEVRKSAFRARVRLILVHLVPGQTATVAAVKHESKDSQGCMPIDYLPSVTWNVVRDCQC
jgi:hypothetical protein